MNRTLAGPCAAILCLGLIASVANSAVAQDMTAKACTADSGVDRAMCVAQIGGARQMLSDQKTVCSPNSPDDLSDTYAVIDFIRAHPERQSEDVGAVTEDVLTKLYPCP
jgi:hypothetical protein